MNATVSATRFGMNKCGKVRTRRMDRHPILDELRVVVQARVQVEVQIGRTTLEQLIQWSSGYTTHDLHGSLQSAKGNC